MTFLIHWHSLLFFLTCFPGILLILLRKNKYFKYYGEFYKYIFVLVAIIITNVCFYSGNVYMYICVLLVLIVPTIIYIVEKIMIDNKNILDFYNNNSKFILSVLIAYPFLEELNFRYFIFLFSQLYGYNVMQYIILSVLTFVFSHFLYQGKSSIVKLLFATIQAIIYFSFENIFLNIIIHMIFNILVYSSRMKKFKVYKYI